jgi:hypothetical protein
MVTLKNLLSVSRVAFETDRQYIYFRRLGGALRGAENNDNSLQIYDYFFFIQQGGGSERPKPKQ